MTTNRHQPPSRGIVFGKSEGKYIVKPESRDGHTLVVGGIGSGKSSCIAMPTIRAWQSRIFAIDIKGELLTYAKKYRSNIKVFSPQDRGAYGYDPYAFLRISSNPTQEARAIADAIMPLPPEVKDPFWIESAQSLLTGAILHYHAAGYSFIETLKAVQKNGAKRLIEAVTGGTDDTAQLYMGGFVDMADKTLSSVFAEVSRGIISLVTDADVVSALSSRKTIEPADLEYGYDIFLNVPEHLLRQWKNLLSLMVNQFLLFFERRDEKHDLEPILFLLDEFPRLGKIPFIMDALATLRSKRVSICMILQSLSQLDLSYGVSEREVIADTCAYKAVLSATDPKTQEYFSKLVGTYEKTKKIDGMSYDPSGILGRGKNKQTTTEEKRIIKPEEFATLGDIVLLHPFKPGFLRVDKVPYYVMND